MTYLKTPFTTKYTYKSPKGILNKEESKTYQECKDDCDINVLYKRYLSKGFTPPNVKQLEQRYSDISEAKTFEEMLNIQKDVHQIFDSLPSEIRKAVDFDVDTFVELISTPSIDPEVSEFQNEVFTKLGMFDRKESFQEIRQSVQEQELSDVEPNPDPIEKKSSTSST